MRRHARSLTLLSGSLLRHPAGRRPLQRLCTERLGAALVCRQAALTTSSNAFCSSGLLKQSWSRNNARRWMCVDEACRSVNVATAQKCEKCGRDKPQLRGWKCVLCATRNHSGVKKCKKCDAPAEESSDFWMCAACGENNRVDEVEDNSRCGYCLYDMAPLSDSEEALLESAQRRQQQLHEAQTAFDSVNAVDAERNYGDALAGAAALPTELSRPVGVQVLVTEAEPFRPRVESSRRSKLHRRHFSQAGGAAAVQTGGAPPGPPGFDWMCREPECAHINPGDEERCEKCGTNISPDDWECQECAALNHLSRSRCFSCSAAIPVFWTCRECGGTTSIYDRECRRCHAQRPLAEPRFPSAQRDPPFGEAVPGQSRPRRGDWFCRACSAHNFSRRTDCFTCGAARAGPGSADGHDDAGHGRAAVGANNWKCEQCHADNFRTRGTCWQCKAAAPAWTRGGGEHHTGLVARRVEREGFQPGPLSPAAQAPSEPLSRRSGEWTCNKCYAKNFGRNAECFKCGAPKSVAPPSRRARARRPVKL